MLTNFTKCIQNKLIDFLLEKQLFIESRSTRITDINITQQSEKFKLKE